MIETSATAMPRHRAVLGACLRAAGVVAAVLCGSAAWADRPFVATTSAAAE